MGILDTAGGEPARRNRKGEKKFTGQINLGASGAIAAAGNSTPGFTVVKTATKVGRYTVQLVDSRGLPLKANALTSFSATVGNPGADAAYTTAKGAYAQYRNVTVSTNGQFEIQLVRTDTAADAEAMDNATILVEFAVKFSSVLP